MSPAYPGEIGTTGALIHPRHERFHDGPAFDHDGFSIPEGNARGLGACFAEPNKEFPRTGTPEHPDPGRWAADGADLPCARVAAARPGRTTINGPATTRGPAARGGGRTSRAPAATSIAAGARARPMRV